MFSEEVKRSEVVDSGIPWCREVVVQREKLWWWMELFMVVNGLILDGALEEASCLRSCKRGETVLN